MNTSVHEKRSSCTGMMIPAFHKILEIFVILPPQRVYLQFQYMYFMMKKLILIFASLATFAGCEMLGLDFTFPDSEDKENPDLIMPKDTIYLLQEDIDSFESVFVTKDGYCMGILKDTTFAYAAAIDSIKGNGTLVIYYDEIGKVRRLYAKDHTIDLSYNDDGSVNLWYQDTDGTSEIVNDIILSSSKRSGIPTTKAGDVLDPMDFTALLALVGLADVGKAVAMSPIIGSALKATVAADLLTSGKFSNLSTEVLTGVSSVAIAAIIGANLPLAALLAAINIANASISDWQNAVANSYFGSARPVTGEAVQLTDKHFVVSYSITDVDPGKTDFNVGVIVADGLFITKNHNLLKKTIPYSSSNGRIIINIGDLNPKEGDKFKYRVFIESTIDNGFKWDDMMLDYWRYGAVRDLIIDEPAIRINSTEQTNAKDNNGHSYTFDFNVSTSNEIPFEVDGWGVAIYETFSEKCESNDDLKDSKSAEGQGTKILAFTVNVNEVMMNTDREPYTPIINHFAVPYISFDGHTYGIFDNAVKIKLEYKEKEIEGEIVSASIKEGDYGLYMSIDANVKFSGDYHCYITNNGEYCEDSDFYISSNGFEEKIVNTCICIPEYQTWNYDNFIVKVPVSLHIMCDNGDNDIVLSPCFNEVLIYSEKPSITINSEPDSTYCRTTYRDDNTIDGFSEFERLKVSIDITGRCFFERLYWEMTVTDVTSSPADLKQNASGVEHFTIGYKYPQNSEIGWNRGYYYYLNETNHDYIGTEIIESGYIRSERSIILKGVLYDGETILTSNVLKSYYCFWIHC